MFKHQEIWLPDGEKHFPTWMDSSGEIVDGRGTYQIKKWRACIPFTRNWRVAVDVGAHVGLWSIQMMNRFETVHAFEPVSEFRACWVENLGLSGSDDGCGDGHTNLYDCALGAEPGRVNMKYDQADSGGTHIAGYRADGAVEIRTLDSFSLENVDFLKIDCEGFEHHVLRGAVDTLKRCRPCVIVEQKPHKLGPNFGITGTPAVDFLRDLGAQLRTVMSGDFVMSWN